MYIITVCKFSRETFLNAMECQGQVLLVSFINPYSVYFLDYSIPYLAYRLSFFAPTGTGDITHLRQMFTRQNASSMAGLR